MRLIGHSTMRATAPVLLWAQDKEVGPAFDRDSMSTFQTVWKVLSPGAWAGATGLSPLRPGDWVFLPRGRRRQRFAPGVRLWSVGYRAGPPGAPGGWFDRAGPIVLRGCAALERATLRLRRLIQAEAGEQLVMHSQLGDLRCTHDAWLRIYAGFHLWLATVASTLTGAGVVPDEEAEVDARLDAAMAAIAASPWSRHSDPLPLARAAGLSRRRLEQLFRHELGCGIAEHRRRERLRLACSALDDHGRQIKEIAASLGFASASAFSTWFRRQSGRSPRFHRQRAI